MGQHLKRISSGTPWEPVVGYSRAVRAGDWLAISGTTATDERGTIVGVGQMYVQARQALDNISRALEAAGLALSDVVRTRMFVTDIERFHDAARAHREFFGEHPPAATMVEVRRLVHPQMMIEIEVDALAAPRPPAVQQTPAATPSAIRAPSAPPKAAPRAAAPPKAAPAPKLKAAPKPKPAAKPKAPAAKKKAAAKPKKRK
jgi:enamine deaminase RidA (YjgF/YER057c/UK114 family)